jgi:5-methylcytosine-specific restriction endonuclease McrA
METHDYGACLLCGKCTRYGKPAKAHRKQGQRWLDKLFAQQPPKYTRRGNVFKINGHCLTVVVRFCCPRCIEQLEIRKQAAGPVSEELPICNPTKITNKQSKDLRAMDYKQFLLTPYWKEVRKIKLSSTERQCEQCGSKTKLQVHHTSYKRHGREHKHLEDLKVLCQTCHEAEHGL